MAEATKNPHCVSCGGDLDGEQLDCPRLDGDRDPICDDCYHDKYEFTCCRCQEYGNVEDQHNMLVVFQDVSDVQPGIYRVVHRPYASQPMIGMGSLHASSLKRIADVCPDINGGWYPCGHLCLECQRKVED